MGRKLSDIGIVALGFVLLLFIAGCADNRGADERKNGGFYGGVSAGASVQR